MNESDREPFKKRCSEDQKPAQAFHASTKWPDAETPVVNPGTDLNRNHIETSEKNVMASN